MIEAEILSVECPFCRADIPGSARKCRHCGEWVNRPCEGCGTPLRAEWAARGVCVECVKRRREIQSHVEAPLATPIGRSRGLAIVLSFLGGGFGLHRFYLGRRLSGVLYLLFFWTGIPALLGIFEGFRLAFMNEWSFRKKYG